jgi:hypothetical protein
VQIECRQDGFGRLPATGSLAAHPGATEKTGLAPHTEVSGHVAAPFRISIIIDLTTKIKRRGSS